jgi:hypothetical protein
MEGKKIGRGRRRRIGNSFWLQQVFLTVFLEDSHRGTVVAGNFGLGGQETVRIPGAREQRETVPSWLGGYSVWAGFISFFRFNIRLR